MKRTILLAIVLLAPQGLIHAQEASAGLDLRGTVAGEAMASVQPANQARSGLSATGGIRSILYPTLKLDQHWTVTGALELLSNPFDVQDLRSAGQGVRGRVLQAALGYSKVWGQGSLAIRAGQMTSAFGSFLLRYDDAENPLVNAPLAYGYYYNPVATLGLAGVQADVTYRKWDGRLQLTNSSPAGPRSLFDKDQYANWTWGGGYTVRQGLRVGFSGYRGPYLHRGYAFFFPGEAKPRDLPAGGTGIDVDWGIGHWNVRGEWQRFVMDYTKIPNFHQSGSYAEVKRSLHPRWFVAARAGYLHTSALSGSEAYEAAIGYRPNSYQLLKAGYVVTHSQNNGAFGNTFVFQVVTSIHPLSMAWH